MGIMQSVFVCVWSLLAVCAFVGMFFNPAHVVTFAGCLALAAYSRAEKRW